MIKKNPDDSVLNEQFGVNENTAESTETGEAEKAKTNETEPREEEKGKLKKEAGVKEESDRTEAIEDVTGENVPGTPNAVIRNGNDVDLDNIELPPVDYSGYSKNELVETLGLIIDNRPPSEIRDDVERIKIFFYKKLKSENE